MARVKSIRYIGEQPVYNMEVKDHHNFSVAGGLIVHNCGYGLISHHSNKTELEVTFNYKDLSPDILEDIYRCKTAEERQYILSKIGRLPQSVAR